MICTRCHREDGTHEPGCGEPSEATVTMSGDAARNAHRSGFQAAIETFSENPVSKFNQKTEEAAWKELVADQDFGPQWHERDESALDPCQSTGNKTQSDSSGEQEPVAVEWRVERKSSNGWRYVQHTRDARFVSAHAVDLSQTHRMVPLFTRPVHTSGKEAGECEALRAALEEIRKLTGDRFSHVQLKKIDTIARKALEQK